MFVSGNSLSKVKIYFSEQLNSLFSEREIRMITNSFIRARLGDVSLGGLIPRDIRFSESDLLFFRNAIKQLQNGIPFQYVLGNVFFHSLELRIAPGALIPRPETEELVEWIIQENNESHLSILDIGTGSGCIALTLKAALPNSHVHGLDVSPEAIKIAEQNASLHHLDVTFSLGNILEVGATSSPHQVNIIVSNPPYICEKEKKDMATHVIEHEPLLALFVPDHDPLLFYKEITFYAKKNLIPSPSGVNGKLYFEVHEQYAQEVAELLESNEFISVEIKKDLQGKQRMVRGILK